LEKNYFNWNIYKQATTKLNLNNRTNMEKNNNADLGTFGKDWVFVLERASDSDVEVKSKSENGDYILEGIAAVFGKENNNHRIYEEKEYLPHLEYLQKKIAKKSLLGELDHPANFETSLKNASHVVESLEYDQANRNVRIKIRLINGHPAGEMAKALVNAGVPLHISSRAAGVVKENKQVQIKKIFTYDLVESPGFEQAELERIYESVMTRFNNKDTNSVVDGLEDVTKNVVGEKSDSYKIYRIDENHQGAFFKALEIQEKNNISEMAKNDFVTVDELNGYSQVIKKELDTLKEKIKNPTTNNTNENTTAIVDVLEERIERIEKYMKYIAENVDKNIQYSEYLAENVDKSIEYSKYLAENLDKTISYGEYLAENVDKSISYGEYLAENLDKSIIYANYLAENLEKGISYSEYLAENVDKAISYGEYLAENLDRTIAYGEYLAENLDKSLDYSEYIAEKVDQSIAYGEYLAETVDKGITYSEYLAEKIEKNIAYSEYIAENVNTEAPKVAATTGEKPAGVNETVDYSTLTTKINSLLETVKNQKTVSTLNESKYNFYKLLNEDKRKEFVALDETKKEKVVKALENGAYFSEMDIIKKWDASLTEQEVPAEPKFITEMPEKYKPIWESLSIVEQEGIISASKLKKLDTTYQINNFWATRPGMSKEKAVGLIRLNENETAVNAAKPNMSGYSNDYMTGVADELAKRFKK